MGTQKRELHARLRGLRERAETARKAAKQPFSQSFLQQQVQATGLPGGREFTGKRASDWAPKTIERFKVPLVTSDDAVLALVGVWSQWAKEDVNQQWWRRQLELVREEQDREIGGEPTDVTGFARGPSRAASPVLDPRYARREGIHSRFEEHMTAGVKRVLLVGQAGMGKTKLATELPKAYAADTEILFISAHSREALGFQLVAATRLHGLQGSDLTSWSPAHQLAALLSAVSGPKFVILDNVESPSDLAGLVPEALRATVIATCRTSTHVPRGWAVVDVGRMASVESRDMILRALPNLSQRDADELASCFHGHALVTKYACTLLEHVPTPVGAFVAKFADSRGDFVSGTPSDDGVVLADILKTVLSLVSDRNGDAAAILDMVGVIAELCGYGGLPHDYVAKCLATAHGRNSRSADCTDLGYLAAVKTIHEFRFIEREEMGCFYVHPLVADVLAGLVRNRLPETLPAMVIAYAQVLPPGRRSGRGGWWEYRTYSEAVTRVMGHLMVKRIAYIHIDRIMARAYTVIPPREAREFHDEFVKNSLREAESRHAGNPQLTWRLGRTAYNLIEGHGSRLDFLLRESQLVGWPRPPSLEELRTKFTQAP